MSHSSSNLAQYYKFAEFGVNNFKPKLIIYLILPNDYSNRQYGKYNFNLINNGIELNKQKQEKKLIHKILIKSNFVRYIYYNLQPLSKINYILNKDKIIYEGNMPCEFKEKKLLDAKKSFDLFLKFNEKFLKENIDIILMFHPIVTQVYYPNKTICKSEGFASIIRDYSIKKNKKEGISFIETNGPFFILSFTTFKIASKPTFFNAPNA